MAYKPGFYQSGALAGFRMMPLMLLAPAFNSCTQAPPNVVLIMTDDQGYGDLACHGNPYVKTPNLDKFYGESVRFTDFHVDPCCSPSRSALLTG